MDWQRRPVCILVMEKKRERMKTRFTHFSVILNVSNTIILNSARDIISTKALTKLHGHAD